MDSNEKPTEEQLAWSQEIPNYGNKLLKRLDEFRKTTILYDVRVRAEGGEFNAHKVILAACGGIFRTCFVDEKKKMISGECTELNLECPAQGLKPIIRFAYTGALVVTKRNAVATMIAAEVTKMKEVQEICADIAVKEYGWVVNFSGEKDTIVLENLIQVLTLHTTCFANNSSANGSSKSEDSELPFDVEVTKDYPEHVNTYHKLAIKLKHAEDVTAAKNKKNEVPKAETVEKPASKKEALQDSVKPKPETLESSNKESSDGKDVEQPVKPKKSPPERPKPVAITVSSDDTSEGKLTEEAPKKPAPPPSPRVKKRASTKSSKQDTTDSDKDSVDGKDVEQPVTLRKSPPEGPKPAITVSTDDSDEAKSTEATPKKEAPPPSPRVKPRTSVKAKKAPPAPLALVPGDKTLRSPAPPRPTKQPAKAPPPRPKPPVKKKTSSQDAPAENVTAEDDYDDTLNPFA